MLNPRLSLTNRDPGALGELMQHFRASFNAHVPIRSNKQLMASYGVTGRVLKDIVGLVKVLSIFDAADGAIHSFMIQTLIVRFCVTTRVSTPGRLMRQISCPSNWPKRSSRQSGVYM